MTETLISLTKFDPDKGRKISTSSPSLLKELREFLLRPANSAASSPHFNRASQIVRLGIEADLKEGKLNKGIGGELRRLDGANIVDLGSGRNCPFQGVFDRFTPNSRIISIDLDERNFALYEGSLRNREFRKDDAQTLTSVPDASVGVVFESLLMNDNPNIDGVQVQAQVIRILREGGLYICNGTIYFRKENDRFKGPFSLDESVT